MTGLAMVNKYLNSHYEGMEPEQLILLLYRGALDRIRLTREGIQEKNIRKRGENLSKVIAIISELYSAVDPKVNDESTKFLRGLYTAILTELPKVSIDNNIQILDTTESYIQGLMDIWENTVMGKTTDKAHPALVKPVKKNNPSAVPAYGGAGTVKRFNAISV